MVLQVSSKEISFAYSYSRLYFYDDGYIPDREEDADEYENDDYTSDSEDGFDSDDLNDEDF